jgi:hypothetical protein
MQVFYAMHARKWSIALLIDETSFVVAHKEGMALTLSPPQNLAKPKVLSLLGAMLEIVRLGRNKIPAGDEVKPAATAAPRTKQTARRGGAPASFSSAHMVDQKPQYDSDDYAERFKYESDGDLYYGFDNARSIKEAMFGYDSDGRRYSTNDEANVNSDHSDWGY